MEEYAIVILPLVVVVIAFVVGSLIRTGMRRHEQWRYPRSSSYDAE